jgi:flagellar biosynthetic protein FliQ
MDLFQAMLVISAKVTGPVLLVALAVGLVVGVLQAATQINEASISFVTKLLAICVAFVVLGPWIMQQMVDYTTRTIESISGVVR